MQSKVVSKARMKFLNVKGKRRFLMNKDQDNSNNVLLQVLNSSKSIKKYLRRENVYLLTNITWIYWNIKTSVSKQPVHAYEIIHVKKFDLNMLKY